MILRWGILGLGKIANKFCQDLLLLEGHTIQAAGSRSLDKANAFGQTYDISSCYDSYEKLFDDPDVDIIYIATPHNSHFEYAIEAMFKGKHVLCEKPLAVNKSQVEKMIAASQKNEVFLMEAFWTRFNPSIESILQKINNGVIGNVNYINADFTFYRDAPAKSRMVNMDLAGGALLDVGVYPIFLAYLLKGMPEQIFATANKHSTGADLQTSAILKYDDSIVNMMCGFRSNSDMVAKIYGDKGKIFIESRWHETQGYRIEKNDQVESFSLPTNGKGFTYEMEECRSCIIEGKLQSSKWSHLDSLNLISITDEIRRQTDTKYPFE